MDLSAETSLILEALSESSNESTAKHAKDVLLGRPLEFTTQPALEAAKDGRIGGLLQAVVMGNKLRMWQVADPSNREMIEAFIPAEIKERY